MGSKLPSASVTNFPAEDSKTCTLPPPRLPQPREVCLGVELTALFSGSCLVTQS